ncbi:PrsW family intramembrane metalloprotease [Sphaerothrix gracilis]|uniref:PrsW family intramembrane metalloprotease n=1 Tax=Sphaerothrix gracilis TaxID=3151835 RepID=UPI0031FCCFA7
MSLPLTALALAIPAYFYTWLVRSIDRFEKEPARYLISAFCWGAVPAIVLALRLQISLALPIETILGQDSLQSELIQSAIGAPVTEEFAKAIAVAVLYYTRRHEFDGWVDGMVYGAMAGFGFAYVENILYLAGTSSWEEWLSLFVLRTIVFGGLHGFWTAIVGIGFGLARYMHNPLGRVVTVTTGLLTAMALHLVHNGAIALIEVRSDIAILVAVFNYGALCLAMLLLWWLAARCDRARLRTHLVDEVPWVLSRSCYRAIASPKAYKLLAAMGFSTKQQRQLMQLAAELAHKKLQHQKMGDENGNRAEIERLRKELRRYWR